MYTLIITGASGTGKTSAVNALAARSIPGVHCFHFDEIGVPSAEVMERDYGGGEGWQAWAAGVWLERLDALPGTVRIAILDAQVRPSFITAAIAKKKARRYVRVVLLDCAHAVREARLRDGRNQPELVNSHMTNWAAYLRGQADALNLPIVDTTSRSVDKIADCIAEIVASLAAGRR